MQDHERVIPSFIEEEIRDSGKITSRPPPSLQGLKSGKVAHLRSTLLEKAALTRPS